jgi:hypothetical protein
MWSRLEIAAFLPLNCRSAGFPFDVRVKRRKAPRRTRRKRMKYVLALITDEGARPSASPEEQKAVLERWQEYTKRAVDNGAFIAGEALEPTTAASTVTIKEGEEPIVSDGPFAESKEQLGGFYLFECEDLDEAIEYAKGIPFQNGSVEIRPVMSFTDLGYESFTPGPVKATVQR